MLWWLELRLLLLLLPGVRLLHLWLLLVMMGLKLVLAHPRLGVHLQLGGVVHLLLAYLLLTHLLLVVVVVIHLLLAHLLLLLAHLLLLLAHLLLAHLLLLLLVVHLLLLVELLELLLLLLLVVVLLLLHLKLMMVRMHLLWMHRHLLMRRLLSIGASDRDGDHVHRRLFVKKVIHLPQHGRVVVTPAWVTEPILRVHLRLFSWLHHHHINRAVVASCVMPRAGLPRVLLVLWWVLLLLWWVLLWVWMWNLLMLVLEAVVVHWVRSH